MAHCTRESKLHPPVRIVGATGLYTADVAGKIGCNGLEHFLTKPYTAQILLELVREVIDPPIPAFRDAASTVRRDRAGLRKKLD